ncbi:MAG: FtsQ-type POTRA domain-containing protein [bacterium]|nr:FtsQ-type POTRA domain-containing protein [bacterium]
METNNEKIVTVQKDFFRERWWTGLRPHVLRIICLTIIAAAVLMVFIRSLQFIRHSEMFHLNKIILKGNHDVKFEDILETLEIKDDRKNIFQISLNGIKKKLETHPRIRTAYVTRELPDKLVIQIFERRSVALINIRNDISPCLYEIDAEGYLIGQDPYLAEYDLPVITDDGIREAGLGDRIRDEDVLRIVNVLKTVEKDIFQFGRLIAEINVSQKAGDAEITLYLNFFNTRIMLGKTFSEKKLKRLNTLLVVLGEKVKDVEYIDFKFDEAVSRYKI